MDTSRKSPLLKTFFSIGVFLVLCLSFSTESGAANWYVDSAATGANKGTSWDNAWTEFSSVVWGATGVKAGDTLYISGGATSCTYGTRLLVGASGISGAPITIRIGQEAGHNGKAIISPATAYHSSITINEQKFIVISGQVGTGTEPRIQCTPLTTGASGVLVTGNASNFDIGYLDITGGLYCGLYVELNDTSDGGEIHHCRLHDNYYDEGRINAKTAVLGTRYGVLKIHDNDIYNFHMDAFKISLHGVDFYNNTVRDRGDYHADVSEHPDGLQVWSSYFRVYGNRFYNFTRPDEPNVNSYMRYNPIPPNQTTPGNVLIFNNLFTETNTPMAGELHRGIELSIGRAGILSARNFLVANNTFSGIPFFTIFLGFGTLPADNVSDIRIVNNIFKDLARTGFTNATLVLTKGDGSVRYGSQGDNVNVVIDYNSFSASSTLYNTNIAFDLGAAGTQNLSYAGFLAAYPIQKNGIFGNPSIDAAYRSTSDTSPVIDSGLDLGSIFSTDIAGSARPQGNAWDIGAYESPFTRRVALPPPVGAIPKSPSGIKIL